jgi:hypothetical protein
VTNWLADPVACAIRLKNESGCAVLAGRNEVMSRTTLVHRHEGHDGVRYEWGHLFVRTKGVPGQQRTMYAGVNLTGDQTVELAGLTPEHANVLSDLLRAAVVNAGGTSCGGQSLYDMVWDEMMSITERLMTGQEAEDDVGAARAIAWVLAVMQNPYLPNVDAVREQVMERWDNEQAANPESPKPTRAQSARVARRRLRAGR